MQGVTGSILLRLYQKYRLISIDQVSQVGMHKIGIHELGLGYRQSSATHLDCHPPKHMAIDGGVTPDQAISAHNAGLDGLAGLHGRKQRDHAAKRKIHPLDRLSGLVQDGTRLQLDRSEPRLHALEFVSPKLPQNAVLYDVL
jgi:hypothetical protein